MLRFLRKPKFNFAAFAVLLILATVAGVLLLSYREYQSVVEQERTDLLETLLLQDDKKTLRVEANGTSVTVPDGWHAIEADVPGSYLLEPDFELSECSMSVIHHKNTGGESATGFFTRYDLGPRFGNALVEPQSGLNTISGHQAAAFEWKNKDLTRFREVYLPYGAYVLEFHFVEDLKQLDKQAKPCYRDFDGLLYSVVLP